MHRLRFIDSHTGGEPTRLILEGFPDLGEGSLIARRERLLRDFDAWRRAIVHEPRGHEALVAAILLPPERPESAFSLIFLNNAGALGMCGHGLIGVLASLGFLGRIGPGRLLIDTPAGQVSAELEEEGEVRFENVPALLLREALTLEVPALGLVRGALAWGGNGFFVVEEHPFELAASPPATLSRACLSIRAALSDGGLGECAGQTIDHIELVERMDERLYRNFVLCPGGAHDRSPCGTGTSALLAVLAMRGALAPGETIRVRSPYGSEFRASYRIAEGRLLPTITGRAHVLAMGELLIDPEDPFAFGLAAAT